MDYSTFLEVLYKIEESLHEKCELFNEISEASKTNRSLKLRFEETLRKADADLRVEKLMAAKEREKLIH